MGCHAAPGGLGTCGSGWDQRWPDPREAELADKGISVVGYGEREDEYETLVGRAVADRPNLAPGLELRDVRRIIRV